MGGIDRQRFNLPQTNTGQTTNVQISPRTGYYISIAQVNVSGVIESNCADITFINDGTSNFSINGGRTYTPGQGLAIGANVGEMDTTQYRILFTAPGVNVCTVIRKMYLDS